MMYISNKTIEVCRQSISSDCVVSAVKNKIHFILYFSVLHIFQRRRSIGIHCTTGTPSFQTLTAMLRSILWLRKISVCAKFTGMYDWYA